MDESDFDGTQIFLSGKISIGDRILQTDLWNPDHLMENPYVTLLYG